MNIIEQGDVLIFEEKFDTKGMERIKEPILAHGEHTGHAHRLLNEYGLFEAESTSNAFELYRQTQTKTLYLRVVKPTDLRHEEHEKITLPPGDYRIGQVREKGMFDDMIAPVVD